MKINKKTKIVSFLRFLILFSVFSLLCPACVRAAKRIGATWHYYSFSNYCNLLSQFVKDQQCTIPYGVGMVPTLVNFCNDNGDGTYYWEHIDYCSCDRDCIGCPVYDVNNCYYPVCESGWYGNIIPCNALSPTATPIPACSVAAPTNFTATRMDGNTVDLAFTDNATNEDRFRIQRRTGPDSGSLGDWTLWTVRNPYTASDPTRTGRVNTPDDTDAPDTQCYRWRVRSETDDNGGCVSAWQASNIICPEPTATPTATNMPTPTLTPIPTSTPAPTNTPIPTPTPITPLCPLGAYQQDGTNRYHLDDTWTHYVEFTAPNTGYIDIIEIKAGNTDETTRHLQSQYKPVPRQ